MSIGPVNLNLDISAFSPGGGFAPFDPGSYFPPPDGQGDCCSNGGGQIGQEGQQLQQQGQQLINEGQQLIQQGNTKEGQRLINEGQQLIQQGGQLSQNGAGSDPCQPAQGSGSSSGSGGGILGDIEGAVKDIAPLLLGLL